MTLDSDIVVVPIAFDGSIYVHAGPVVMREARLLAQRERLAADMGYESWEDLVRAEYRRIHRERMGQQ